MRFLYILLLHWSICIWQLVTMRYQDFWSLLMSCQAWSQKLEIRICKLTQGDNEEYPCHLMILQKYTIVLSPWYSENERLKLQFYWWRIVKDIKLYVETCAVFATNKRGSLPHRSKWRNIKREAWWRWCI